MVSCRTGKPFQSGEGIFTIEQSEKKLIISYDDQYLTTYNFSDTLYKPFFWPVKTLNGISITRGYPVKPEEGEPADHPHQIGIWFNSGNVNGIDFWNNSDAIPKEKKHQYGKIKVDSFLIRENNSRNVVFEVFSTWKNFEGKILLFENTVFTFNIYDSAWSLTRNTSLLADTLVSFHDTKEGLYAIRLAREFQFDMDNPEFIVGSDGRISETKSVNNKGKTGMYKGSNGTRGNDTWGTANEWVEITAFKDRDSISVIMIDHPANFGFPALWHARNYGLFSVNNLGRNSYNPDLPEIHKDLNKGESLTLKHKLIIKNGGSFKKNEIDKFLKSFYSQI